MLQYTAISPDLLPSNTARTVVAVSDVATEGAHRAGRRCRACWLAPPIRPSGCHRFTCRRRRVWFEECVGGTSRRELGLVQTPDESFRLADDDTVASVTAAHRKACATARAAVADLPLDAVVTGHRTGPRTLRWVYLQVLRELAHHCGHADILREQVLAD
jgi:hypothetical protein